MDFVQYIVKEGLIMIAVLYVLGMIITQTETVSNKWIPVILLVISVVLTPLILTGYTPGNIVQGILIAGAAVLGDQLIKQAKKE